MPSVPKIRAGSGTNPGDARTMPTTAVKTINRLTLGLMSSRKSRHRLGPTTAIGGLSGMVDTMQGYHADRRRRPQRPQQPHHADDQKSGAGIVQGSYGQGHTPMHGRYTERNLQQDRQHQQTTGK